MWHLAATLELERRVVRLAGVPRDHMVVGLSVDLEAGLVSWVNRGELEVETLHRARVSPALLRRSLERAVTSTYQ